MKQRKPGIKITQASNGFIVRDHEDNLAVFEEDNNAELAHIVALLRFIVEHFGLSGTRHDESRVTISLAPGDKFVSPKTKARG